MKPNKMKMFLDLQHWIEMSPAISKQITVADSIWDSPHQNSEYAAYVVGYLLKNTPKKQIPLMVLEELKKELIEANEYNPPAKPWWQFWRRK